MRRYIIYLFLFLFIIFVLMPGGVAVGDPQNIKGAIILKGGERIIPIDAIKTVELKK